VTQRQAKVRRTANRRFDDFFAETWLALGGKFILRRPLSRGDVTAAMPATRRTAKRFPPHKGA